MADTTKHPPGMFCWADLGTTDTQAAKAFYPALFGWSAVDTPASHGMVYTLLQVDGKDAAAVYPLMPEQLSQGVPPHWMLYVSVENADAVAARARELGGTVIAGPGDVPEAGRFAIIRDPQGAVFGLWQSGAHIGAPPHWMPYFLVADCDAIAGRAEAAGGKVCVPPTDIPTVGRFAVLNDGQGAYFSIIRLQEATATA